ncbi:MAG: phosphate/phosphite/phosphonate ABC transporter substrate-binding protein [Acholeplasmataceae bacterium]|nr:phosphate/phosphite/phosphonate ABC transporter substrate-binding protein [Acholeplasmataceae bacterium]
MKKVIVLLLFVLMSVGLMGCEGTGTQGDPETLIIQFVPSSSVDSAMLTKLKGLEDILEAELAAAGYEINVAISIGTTYASVVEAMASGQVHVGFLTSQQYAFTTLEYPDKVEVLLTSVRSAYAAQIDEMGDEITDPAVIIANTHEETYAAQYHETVRVSSYYSMLLVRKADYEAGFDSIEDLAGKRVATGNNNSGSGYLYPLFLLHENGLHFVDGVANALDNEVQRLTPGNHQGVVLSLLNEEVDAAFAFLDSRLHATAYLAWEAANPGKTVFGETRVIALTTGIFNDTISSVTSLSSGLKAAIQDAFMAAIETEGGAEALLIYNHTGYLVAEDSDYDGERAFYQFLQTLND